MPTILTSRFRAPNPVQTVSRENQDEWVNPHPINRAFKPLFQAVLQLNPVLRKRNIVVVSNLSEREEDRAKREIAQVYEARFDGWTLALNWAPDGIWRGGIVPDYIKVARADVECGQIGPWADIRTCWSCGMTGYKDPEKTRPCVQPSEFNPITGHWIMRPCPKCGQLDWTAQVLSPDDVISAAAVAIADVTGKPRMFDHFDGVEVDLRKTHAPIAAGG